jgi:site-specific DNA-methyltransferase (adenine-specific)
MGKKWDHHKGGMLEWINWLGEILTEANRTMKPGALGLVWSIPRTSHWTGMAIELAGFRIVDIVHHANGCLSEDTEIYVKGKGWVQFHECETGDTVIGYNVETDSFSFQDVTQTHRFNYSDTAYRIESDFTDQIVSIGHRCIVEQNGTLTFREASTLQQQVSVPFLEGMPKLSDSVSDSQCNASDKEYNLLGELCQAIDFQCKYGSESSVANLPGMRCGVLPENKQHETEVLLKELRGQCKEKRSDNVGSSQEYCQQRTGGLDGRQQGVLCPKHGRGKQSSLEGRRDSIQEKRELQKCSICSMPQGILGNGSEGWVCNGTPTDNGSNRREMPAKDGSCSSHQPRSNRQSDQKFDALSKQPGSQIVRTRESGCKTTLATVTPFHYEGVVWCVSVPDTAFIARRNGKIFVTGNSGFPKAQDIGKLIDNMAGAEREVVGKSQYAARRSSSPYGQGATQCVEIDSRNITAPATDEAKQWDGWKTPALKPAVEGWWLIQKPISESSIARNILKHGVGGINIEACRIESKTPRPKLTNEISASGLTGTGGSNTLGSFTVRGSKAIGTTTEGRYPANLVLSCGANCDGGDHSPDCPVSVIGDQSEWMDSGKRSPQGKKVCANAGSTWEGWGMKSQHESISYSDKGTAARYFKQLPFDPETATSIYYQAKASKSDRSSGGVVPNVHPTVKSRHLIAYFLKLITPPGGVVLDCFGGSGTTAVAAIENGFNYCLIEKESEYIEIINQRIAATQLPLFQAV